MIQAVISRLAAQSTTVKGWSITLTGALLGYGATTATPVLALIAAYVVLAFAALDGYYLSVERAYRGLYADAVAGSAAQWSLTVDRPTRAGYLSATLSPANVILIRHISARGGRRRAVPPGPVTGQTGGGSGLP
jgi:hypothetical protein